MTLTKEEKKKTKKLVVDLNNAFDWCETKQGYNYWKKIVKELRELAKKETKCPTRGKWN